MRKVACLALTLVFMTAASGSAVAQRYSNDDPCTDIVGPECENNWETYGFDSYQECYDTNVSRCESQQGSGQPYDRMYYKFPTCTTSSGINLC